MIRNAVYSVVAVILSVSAIEAPTGPSPGAIDPSFAQRGEAIVQPNTQCASGCVESFGSHAEAVALGPDGSIVLAGNGSSESGGQSAWLARLAPNGLLDTTFGRGGYAEGDPRLAMSRVFVNRDGSVMVLARSAGGGFVLERFTSSGTLDTSFGTGGVRWLTTSIQDRVEGVFDAQGRIVVLGSTTVIGGPAVARFLPSGRPDLKFGRLGIARVASLDEAKPLHLAAESGGALVVAAYGATGTTAGAASVLLARVTSIGTTDRRFGRRGVIQAQSVFNGVDALATGHDRGIVIATSEHPRAGVQPTDKLLVARYTPKGADMAFGVRGVSQRAVPFQTGLGLLVHAIAVERSGNAVLAGEYRERSVDVPRGRWFVARYTPHGRDCAFAGSGWIDGAEGGASGLALARHQRIVIAGWAPGHLPAGAGTAFMAAQYFGDGQGATCPGERHGS